MEGLFFLITYNSQVDKESGKNVKNIKKDKIIKIRTD